MTSSSQAWKRPKSPSAGARSLISHRQPRQKIVPAATGEAVDTAAAATVDYGAFLGALGGAFGGLIAILLGALYNAKLNRERDTRLRNQEIQGLCRAFAAELLICAKNFSLQPVAWRKPLRKKSPWRLKTSEIITIQ